MTLTLHDVTLRSEKPCQHNNKCDCTKTMDYKVFVAFPWVETSTGPEGFMICVFIMDYKVYVVVFFQINTAIAILY